MDEDSPSYSFQYFLSYSLLALDFPGIESGEFYSLGKFRGSASDLARPLAQLQVPSSHTEARARALLVWDPKASAFRGSLGFCKLPLTLRNILLSSTLTSPFSAFSDTTF